MALLGSLASGGSLDAAGARGAWARALALLVGVVVGAGAGAGCAQALSFEECNVDEDCAARAAPDQKLYCTSDHLCVSGVPSERLCPESVEPPPGSSGVMVVASLVDRNDPQFDKNIENAVRLAIEELNSLQAGASLPSLKLVLCDTASDDKQSERAARVAVEQHGAVAIIGPSHSGGVVAVNSYAVQRNVLVISPAATATAISSLQDNNLVWRTAPSDELQARLLAKVVKADAATDVRTIFVDKLYGTGLNEKFREAYTSLGGQGLKDSLSYKEANEAELKAKLNDVSRFAPSHLLLVPDLPDVTRMASLIGTFPGLTQTKFLMGDAARGPALFGGDGVTVDPKVLARIRGTSPAAPSGPAFDAFNISFKNRFGAPANSAFAANAYDAAYLVGAASVVAAGRKQTGTDLASGLARINGTGATVTLSKANYLDLVKAINQGGVTLTGASGPLTFDANGDLTTGAFQVWGVDTTTTPPSFKMLPSPM